MEKIRVDGSYGEGGGQIIRNAVSYTCLLRKEIEVVNIRANRPNPGLASQHLESILAMLRLTGATTSRQPKKFDTEFEMNGTPVPVSSEGVSTTIDLVTAGSVTLCTQCILPYLLSLKSQSNVRIIGGTHVMKSPSFDYLEQIFTPTMKRIGYDFKPSLKHVGFFPRGGGTIDVVVNSSHSADKFKHFEIMERGNLLRTWAILNVTPNMKNRITEFKNKIAEDTRDIEVRIVSYASVEYFVQFENTSTGFSNLAEGRNPSPNQVFDGIRAVQAEMKNFLKTSAAVDHWLQDQLIIYMALAKYFNPGNVSTLRTVEPTDHTLSAIHVSQLFMPSIRFNIEKNSDGSVTISV